MRRVCHAPCLSCTHAFASPFIQEERYKSQKSDVLAGATPPHPLFHLVILSQNYKLMLIIGLIACVCIGILVGVICVAAPNAVRPLSPPSLPFSLFSLHQRYEF